MSCKNFPSPILPPPVDRRGSWSLAPIVVGRQEYSQEESNSYIYISLESAIYCISNNIESPVHIYRSIYILSARLHYIRLNMRYHCSTIYITLSRHLYTPVTRPSATRGARASINTDQCGAPPSPPPVQPCRAKPHV